MSVPHPASLSSPPKIQENASCQLETCTDLHSTIGCKSSSFPAQMSNCLSFLSPAVFASLLPAVIVNKKGTKRKIMFGLEKGYKPLFSHSVKTKSPVCNLQSVLKMPQSGKRMKEKNLLLHHCLLLLSLINLEKDTTVVLLSRNITVLYRYNLTLRERKQKLWIFHAFRRSSDKLKRWIGTDIR